MLLLTTQRFEENNSGTPETTLADGDVFPLQKTGSGRDGHILYSVLKTLIEAGVLTKAVYDSDDDGSVDLADSLDYNTLVYVSKDGTKVSIKNEATGVHGLEVRDGSAYLLSDTGDTLGGGAKPYCFANGSAIMTLATMVNYLLKDGSVAMAVAYSPTPASQDIATANYVDTADAIIQADVDALEAIVDLNYENMTFFIESVTSLKDYGHKIVVVPAGETWYVNRAFFQLSTGTAFIDINQDGTVLSATYTALEPTSVLQDTGVSPVALTSGKRLSIEVTGITGATNVSVTLEIKRVKT